MYSNKVKNKYDDLRAVFAVENFLIASGWTDVIITDKFYSEAHGFTTESKCPWDIEARHPTNGKNYVFEIKGRHMANGKEITHTTTADVLIDQYKCALIQSGITNGCWYQWDNTPNEPDQTRIPTRQRANGYSTTIIIVNYYHATHTFSFGFVPPAMLDNTTQKNVPWATYCDRPNHKGYTIKAMITPPKVLTVQEFGTTYRILKELKNNISTTKNIYDANKLFPTII